jgi:hypothetical protein
VTTRIRDKIESNAFQQLIAAVQSADEKRIEDETVRIARAVFKSKPFEPITPRRSAARSPR